MFFVHLFGGLSVYNVAITITYQVIFFLIQISIILDNVSSQVADKRGLGFGQ
jgi:hypothetical protein